MCGRKLDLRNHIFKRIANIDIADGLLSARNTPFRIPYNIINLAQPRVIVFWQIQGQNNRSLSHCPKRLEIQSINKWKSTCLAFKIAEEGRVALGEETNEPNPLRHSFEDDRSRFDEWWKSDIENVINKALKSDQSLMLRVTDQKGCQSPHLGLFTIFLDGQAIATGSGDANLAQPALTRPLWKCIDQVSLHVLVYHNICIEGALDLELGLSKLAALKVISPNAKPSIPQVLQVLTIIPQTQKAKLKEAYKNKIIPRKPKPLVGV
ncbi:hypothetical protein Tco_1549196 [Tanacetum coccineum]